MAELITKKQSESVFEKAEKANRASAEEKLRTESASKMKALKEIELSKKQKSATDKLIEAANKQKAGAAKSMVNQLASGALGGKVLACVDRAPVFCTMGTENTELKILCHGVNETGLSAAHDEDRSFSGNFGICKPTKEQCVPTPAPRWLLTDEFTMITNDMDLLKALLDEAKALLAKMRGDLQGMILQAHKNALGTATYLAGKNNAIKDNLNALKKMSEKEIVCLADAQEIIFSINIKLTDTISLYKAAVNVHKSGAVPEVDTGYRGNNNATLLSIGSKASKIESPLLKPRSSEVVTEAYGQQVDDLHDKLLEMKNKLDVLQKKWDDKAAWGEHVMNCQLTTASVLPCMKQGGTIGFLDSGQLRKYLTPDMYYQYINQIGIFRSSETNKVPYLVRVGDEMLQGELFEGRTYLSSLDDVKKLLTVLGLAGTGRDGSKYWYMSVDEMLKAANVKRMESPDFPGLVIPTGGNLELKVGEEKLTKVTSFTAESVFKPTPRITIVFSFTGYIKGNGALKTDVIADVKKASKNVVTSLRHNFENWYMSIEENGKALKVGTSIVNGAIVSIGYSNGQVYVSIATGISSSILSKCKVVAEGTVSMDIYFNVNPRNPPAQIQRLLQEIPQPIQQSVELWVQTLNEEVLDAIKSFEDIMNHLVDTMKQIDQNIISQLIIASFVFVLIRVSFKVLW